MSAAYSVKSFAAFNEKDPLGQYNISRRALGENDIKIDIEYCGVCHSDIHFAHNDWGFTTYPVVPGHEIIGRVVDVGKRVKKFKKGDLVGVGCMVDSCGKCHACKKDLEQYCEGENGFTGTYSAPDLISGGVTYGGYSESIVVKQEFVLNVSEKLDTKAVAPLLCAGITTYSPLKNWQVQQGQKVGVIGLGGLGHMGIKFANAMGAHVVMITTSTRKAEDAKKLGAHEVLISKDTGQMAKHASTFDFLLNTIPVPHDINPYLELLKLDTTMAVVGVINDMPQVSGWQLISKRRNIAGSLIGGIKETQDMLDFCAKHSIVCDVEMINMQDINKAYERVINADVKYRFVINMKSIKS